MECMVMQYRFLGNTGLSLSCLGLGAMMFGGPTNPQESEVIIQKAYELGINYFDTANIYHRGESERILGKFLKPFRENVILSTKGGRFMGDGQNQGGLSRVNLIRQVEESLQRLDTDWIDIYLLHLEDPRTSMDDCILTMDNLVRQGKIRYFGCSNFYPSTIVECLWSSDRLKGARLCCLQDEYNLLNRQGEMEVLPICKRHQLGFIVYSPLARGLLAGKYFEQESPPESSRAGRGDKFIVKDWTPERFKRLEEIRKIFSEYKESLSQCAIAWLLHQEAVTSVVLGPRTLNQFLDNIEAMHVRIQPQTFEAFNAFQPVRSWGVPPLRS
jgi:aryl-alcohol dehydrogenase-like predicted oxidoreductase